MNVKKIGRKIIFSCMLGVIIAFCYVGGEMLDSYDSIDFYNKSFYLKWLGAFVPTTIIVYGIFCLFHFIEKKEIFISKQINKGKSTNKWLFIGGVIFLLICWMPVWLSLFPGAFSYDAYDEWQQVKTGVITAHHPVLHVLLLGGLVEGMFTLTGNYNVGIAIYSVIQMLVLAGAFSYAVCFLKEMKLSKWVQFGTLAYYGISPVCGLFSISATKDVLFTAAEILLFVFVVRMLTKTEDFFERKSWCAGFWAAMLGTMIFRNNGLYVALIMLVIVTVCLRKYLKNYWKKYVLLLGLILLPYMMYTGPVYKLLDVEKGGIQEMFSVPIQQMARVYNYDIDSIEEEDLELLYNYLPKEKLKAYKSTLSDPVKTYFNKEYFHENTVDFFKLWIRLGLDNPLTYINSFLTNTVDFWYPNAIVDGYKDVYGRSSYFDYRVAEPGEEIVYLEKLHRFYESISWDKEMQTKPLAFLMLSPGWYFICVLVIFGYFLYEKRYKPAIAALIFVLTFLTVLLGPVALVRYVLIFFMGIPQLVALCFVGPEEKTTQKL